MPNTTLRTLYQCDIDKGTVLLQPIRDLPNSLEDHTCYIGIDPSLFPIDVSEDQEIFEYVKSLLLDPENTQILPGIVKYQY